MDSPELKAEKAALRREAKSRWESITPEQCTALGQAMADELRDDPVWQQAETVLCYLGVEHEPDTRPILSLALAEGKQLCLPRILAPGKMEAALLPELSALVPGAYGIPAPGKDCPAVPTKKIDLVLVPCLAAGQDGSRLGHGGGFYDRFLAAFGGESVLLCPEALVFPAMPCGKWDRKTTRLLTERGFALPKVPDF